MANWRGPYGQLSWAGRTYGLKVHEFRRFLARPRGRGPPIRGGARDRSGGLGGQGAAATSTDWRLVDPRIVADTSGFHRYVRTSGAEFSVAQGVYVETGSGWFSDRTVRYLASGRPALVQDTGFSEHIPVGEGLVAFSNVKEAVNGARRIVENYEQHRAAARQLAEEYFAPERALAPLLDAAEVAQ